MMRHLMKALIYSVCSIAGFMAPYFAYSGGSAAHAALVLLGISFAVAALVQSVLALCKMTLAQRQITYGFFLTALFLLVIIGGSIIDNRQRANASAHAHHPYASSTLANHQPKVRQWK